MSKWLRRLLNLLPRSAQPAAASREADWMARSAVPTEADEEARLRAEEDSASPRTAEIVVPASPYR